MVIINNTLSFADNILESAIKWIKIEYIPLLVACPFVDSAEMFEIEVAEGADECFALQIRFKDVELYNSFTSNYQQDFENVLFAKFKNQFGMFKTVLKSLK